MQPIVLLDKSTNLASLRSETYLLTTNKNPTPWPKTRGRLLGSCGMWNFLWRLGFHPLELTSAQLPTPYRNQTLFVDKIGTLNPITENNLRHWLQQGGKIVATGDLVSWKTFLPDFNWETSFFDNPHAGLGYLIPGYSAQLIAPNGWDFITHNTAQTSQAFVGEICGVQGERQTPERAFLSVFKNAPALIKNDAFYYLNGHVFSAFQAWLQGQEDLSQWLGWRHRLFWLDEWVSFVYDLLLKSNAVSPPSNSISSNAFEKNTVILRHDLDYSRDTSFLAEEQNRNIPATHAILKDKNRRFWTKTLRQFPTHENAFHYNTGKRNWGGLISKLLLNKERIAFLPHFKQISGKGLLKQIKWAKQNGIGTQTIHRHLSYMIYPEWIDAMDEVFETDLGILGGSTLFRGEVLKWGINHCDSRNISSQWPDAQFPLWYPFKLSHAGKAGKILKGWEMAALMEIEPELLIQLLDHKVNHIKQNIFTLIFHPAHAAQSSFYKNGSFNYFKKILDILEERNVPIMTMREVLQLINGRFRM